MAESKPIRAETEYKAALRRVSELMDARQGEPEFDELEALAPLVEAYEDEHYPIGHPTAAGAIEFRMDQEGLTPGRIARRRRKRRIPLSLQRPLHNPSPQSKVA